MSCLLLVLACIQSDPIIQSSFQFQDLNEVEPVKLNATKSNDSTDAVPVNWNTFNSSAFVSKLAKQAKTSILSSKLVQSAEKANSIPVDGSTDDSQTSGSPFTEPKASEEVVSPNFGTAATQFTVQSVPGTLATGEIASATPQVPKPNPQPVPFIGNQAPQPFPGTFTAVRPYPFTPIPYWQMQAQMGQKSVSGTANSALPPTFPQQIQAPAQTIQPHYQQFQVQSPTPQFQTPPFQPPTQQLQAVQFQNQKQVNWTSQGVPAGTAPAALPPVTGATGTTINGLPIFPNLAAAASWFRKLPSAMKSAIRSGWRQQQKSAPECK